MDIYTPRKCHDLIWLSFQDTSVESEEEQEDEHNYSLCYGRNKAISVYLALPRLMISGAYWWNP